MAFATIKEVLTLPSNLSLEELQRKYPKIYRAILNIDRFPPTRKVGEIRDKYPDIYKSVLESANLNAEMTLKELEKGDKKLYKRLLDYDKEDEVLRISAVEAAGTYENSLNCEQTEFGFEKNRSTAEPEEEKNQLREKFDSAIAALIPIVRKYGMAFKIACLGIGVASGIAGIFSAATGAGAGAGAAFIGIAAGGFMAATLNDFVEKIMKEIEMKRIEVAANQKVEAVENKMLEQIKVVLGNYFTQQNEAKVPDFSGISGTAIELKENRGGEVHADLTDLNPKQHIDGEHHLGSVEMKASSEWEEFQAKSLNLEIKRNKEYIRGKTLPGANPAKKPSLISKVRSFFNGFSRGK